MDNKRFELVANNESFVAIRYKRFWKYYPDEVISLFKEIENEGYEFVASLWEDCFIFRKKGDPNVYSNASKD